MKIAYIGIDPLYPALPALAEAGGEIIEIFTCKTDNQTEFNLEVCDFARRNAVPLTVGKITAGDIRRLSANGCQAVICGGYYYRIPVDGSLPMVNIHPSLLPNGRGAWPMPVTILRGITESGVTVHKMTERFDEGDILLREAVAVSPDDNLQTLLAKQQALLPDMMRRLVADFDRLYAQAVPQGEGEYWPCPAEDDYPITQDMPAQEADRILRAFYGYECVYRAGEKTYGLVGGELHPVGCGDFPVRGGSIKAKRVRER